MLVVLCSIRNSDIERPSSPQNDGVDNLGGNGTTTETINHEPKPSNSLIFKWDVMFLVSCVIAVLMDPLFFYYLVINEDDKCLAFNGGLRIFAIYLRSITTLIYMMNVIWEFFCPRIDKDASRIFGRTDHFFTDACLIAKRYLRSHLVIDILAIPPLPQVRETIDLLLNCFL